MKNLKICAAIIAAIALLGCEKYLDEKPSSKLVVPTSTTDLQALLDDYVVFNQSEPEAPVLASDDHQLSYAAYQALPELARNMHIWAPALQFSSTASDSWSTLYLQVYRANVALDNLPRIPGRGSAEWNNVRGQALFIRGKALLSALLIWTVGYNRATADAEPGVPLRLDVNFNTTSARGNQQQGFDQVVKDLREGAGLLPDLAAHPIRPSKAAAYGYLARAFLAMGMADSCLKYVDLSLSIKNTLMDYNGGAGVSPTAEYPFSRFNPEVIYDACAGQGASISNAMIDPLLYASYSVNDLRRTRFHRSATSIGYFKGSYNGSFELFTGIATDELLLMRAECLARGGETTAAMDALNLLLDKRFSRGSFMPLAATDAADALAKILSERRKELVFRGLRWMDLKRLNAQGAGIELQRNLNGVQYVLEPNSRGYAMPLPERVVLISGMPQNTR